MKRSDTCRRQTRVRERLDREVIYKVNGRNNIAQSRKGDVNRHSEGLQMIPHHPTFESRSIQQPYHISRDKEKRSRHQINYVQNMTDGNRALQHVQVFRTTHMYGGAVRVKRPTYPCSYVPIAHCPQKCELMPHSCNNFISGPH